MQPHGREGATIDPAVGLVLAARVGEAATRLLTAYTLSRTPTVAPPLVAAVV